MLLLDEPTDDLEVDSRVVWFEGDYQAYEEDRKKRLGEEADRPHRIRYKKLGV